MKKTAPFLVLSAGILWGIIGLFVRKLNAAGMGSMEIVAVRSVTTTLLLFPALLLYDRTLLKIRIKDIWCFIGTGVCSIVFFNYCYFKAMTMISLSVAAVLLYTAPAIVMLLSAVFFREKITGRKIISILMTFCGCVFVTGIMGNSGSFNMAGILFGLGAGLGYALYSIFSRFALERRYHPLTITFYTFVCSCVTIAPLADIRLMVDICISKFDIAIFCIVFGLISTVVPYIVYTLGLTEMENSKASIIASIEPVTATLLSVLVFRESLDLLQIAGILLVLGAIFISNISQDKQDKKNK